MSNVFFSWQLTLTRITNAHAHATHSHKNQPQYVTYQLYSWSHLNVPIRFLRHWIMWLPLSLTLVSLKKFIVF